MIVRGEFTFMTYKVRITLTYTSSSLEFLDRILESAGFMDGEEELDLSVKFKEDDIYEDFDKHSGLKYDALGDAINKILTDKKKKEPDVSSLRPPSSRPIEKEGEDEIKTVSKALLIQIPKTKVRKSHPHKITLLNVNEFAKKKDIVKALENACDKKKLDIVDVIFYEEGGHKRSLNAFVVFSSQNDLMHVLDNAIRTFGIYIGERRCKLESIDNRRSLSIRLPVMMKKEEIIKIFTPWGLSASDLTILSLRNHPTDRSYGVTITFKTHEIAYSVWATINSLDIYEFDALWVQPVDGVFMVLSRTRDRLTEENLKLREKLEQMKRDHSFFEMKYRDILCEHNVNEDTTQPEEEDLSFHHALYEHLKRVAEITQGNRDEALTLLNLTKTRLTRLLLDLKQLGYDEIKFE